MKLQKQIARIEHKVAVLKRAVHTIMVEAPRKQAIREEAVGTHECPSTPDNLQSPSPACTNWRISRGQTAMMLFEYHAHTGAEALVFRSVRKPFVTASGKAWNVRVTGWSLLTKSAASCMYGAISSFTGFEQFLEAKPLMDAAAVNRKLKRPGVTHRLWYLHTVFFSLFVRCVFKFRGDSLFHCIDNFVLLPVFPEVVSAFGPLVFWHKWSSTRTYHIKIIDIIERELNRKWRSQPYQRQRGQRHGNLGSQMSNYWRSELEVKNFFVGCNINSRYSTTTGDFTPSYLLNKMVTSTLGQAIEISVKYWNQRLPNFTVQASKFKHT